MAATARFIVRVVGDLANSLLQRWLRFHQRLAGNADTAVVGVDILPLASATGIGWYLRNLLEALDQDDLGLRLNLYGRVFLAADDEPPPANPGSRNMFLRVHQLPEQFLFPAGASVRLLRAVVAPVLRVFDDNDVLFAPDLLCQDSRLPAPEPVVATAHDLAFAVMPETLRRDELSEARQALAASLFRASRLIAVSDATAEDLSELFTVDRRRIHTVHEGIEARFSADPAPGEPVVDLPERYLLFVSNLEPRKNLVNILRAFHLLVDWGYPGELVLVGEWRGRAEAIRREVETSPVRDRIVRPANITRDMLPAFYRGADALLLPSWLEGFGLPLVEAMACGTPVVTSGRSAMPEVAGPAAVYVDPASAHGIASAVSSLLADPHHRDRLITLGLERAARFSWTRAAAATAQTLRIAAGLTATTDDEYRV